jgi:hypothetical protein
VTKFEQILEQHQSWANFSREQNQGCHSGSVGDLHGHEGRQQILHSLRKELAKQREETARVTKQNLQQCCIIGIAMRHLTDDD